MLTFLIFTAFIMVYTAFSLYSLYHEVEQTPEMIDRKKIITDDEELKKAQEQLLAKPDDADLRALIIFSLCEKSYTFSDTAYEHALWFIKNDNLHSINDHYTLRAVISAPDSSLGTRESKLKYAVNLWKEKLAKNPDDHSLIRLAAKFYTLIESDFSNQCWERYLDLYPFSVEAHVQLSYNIKYATFKNPWVHPNPDLEESLEHKKTAMRRTWSASDSIRMAQIQKRLGKLIFPTPICFTILFLVGLIRQNGKWTDHYDVSDAGIVAFKCADYKYAKKCLKQFLKLYPEAFRHHNYPPIFMPGFSLGALLALYEDNLQEMHHYLSIRIKDQVDSEFSFIQEDQEIIIHLIKKGYRDIAVDYMEKRAQSVLPNEKIQLQIDFVKNGGDPFTEEYYNRKITR